MQLQGATELETRIYNLCRRFEAEGGCGELQTAVVSALSDANAELQRLRGFWPPSERKMDDRVSFHEMTDGVGVSGIGISLDGDLLNRDEISKVLLWLNSKDSDSISAREYIAALFSTAP